MVTPFPMNEMDPGGAGSKWSSGPRKKAYIHSIPCQILYPLRANTTYAYTDTEASTWLHLVFSVGTGSLYQIKAIRWLWLSIVDIRLSMVVIMAAVMAVVMGPASTPWAEGTRLGGFRMPVS